jgi:hypothetical protein
MHTLTLTVDEEAVFKNIAERLKKDVRLESEKLTYADSPERQAIRFKLLSLKDPTLLDFASKAKAAKTDEDFIRIAESMDLTKASSSSVTQILFALGPLSLGRMIMTILSRAQDADDIALVAGLSEIRHDMLESLSLFVHPS